MKTQRMTMLGLFTTIALTIFMIEAAIPTLIPIPGIKLGLANIVTLFVLLRYNGRDAAIVLAARIILSSIFGGQMVYFLYSICGGFFCLIAMILMNRFLKGHFIYLTSVVGAVFHNMGQITAAYVILQMSGILVYVPFLMISGVITGLFTGLVCHFFNRYIPSNYTFSADSSGK